MTLILVDNEIYNSKYNLFILLLLKIIINLFKKLKLIKIKIKMNKNELIKIRINLIK